MYVTQQVENGVQKGPRFVIYSSTVSYLSEWNVWNELKWIDTETSAVSYCSEAFSSSVKDHLTGSGGGVGGTSRPALRRRNSCDEPRHWHWGDGQPRQQLLHMGLQELLMVKSPSEQEKHIDFMTTEMESRVSFATIILWNQLNILETWAFLRRCQCDQSENGTIICVVAIPGAVTTDSPSCWQSAPRRPSNKGNGSWLHCVHCCTLSKKCGNCSHSAEHPLILPLVGRPCSRSWALSMAAVQVGVGIERDPHRWSPSKDGANHRGGKRGSLLPARWICRGVPNGTWTFFVLLLSLILSFHASPLLFKTRCFCGYQIKATL